MDAKARAQLVELLVAVERGVQKVEADVLTVNSPMLALLRALGLPAAVERGAGYNHVIVDIPRRLDDPVRRARARAHIAAAGAVSRSER